jgi:hypothetical protein
LCRTWTNRIEELRQIADGRDDILAEAAGITAGSWYAGPAIHVGYELIGARMLILAGGGRGLPLGLTKTDEEWAEQLDAALTATRRDDLQHGTNAAYVRGCVCRECREHQRVRMSRSRTNPGDR